MWCQKQLALTGELLLPLNIFFWLVFYSDKENCSTSWVFPSDHLVAGPWSDYFPPSSTWLLNSWNVCVTSCLLWGFLPLSSAMVFYELLEDRECTSVSLQLGPGPGPEECLVVCAEYISASVMTEKYVRGAQGSTFTFYRCENRSLTRGELSLSWCYSAFIIVPTKKKRGKERVEERRKKDVERRNWGEGGTSAFIQH